MAGAEEELYKKWKEITLNSTGSDQVRCFFYPRIIIRINRFCAGRFGNLISISIHKKAKYRVWDYPVKEQYTHILRVIEQTGPVSSPEEGITMVSSKKLKKKHQCQVGNIVYMNEFNRHNFT